MYKPSLLLLITVLVLLQTACSAQATPVPTTIPWQATSVQLSWIHSIEFAGFYMAQKEGSFATEGLNVTLKPGGYDAEGREIKPIEEVLAGHADFGIIDGSLLLTARAEGKPIVALTTIYQRHPLALLSLAETGCSS